MTNNRRRILRVMAVGAGALATPAALWAHSKSAELIEWHGTALGADTTIQLYATNEVKARQVLDGARMVIEKYENMFSLYKDGSHTSMLNKNGLVKNADAEFIELVEQSINYSKQTGGAFDITIQPLWNLYSDHFDGDTSDHLEDKIKAVLDLIGSDKIAVEENSVLFTQKNMSVSFNGIAQGYITDKVTEYLRAQGFENVLVDMGEYRAGGPQENGEPWRIGLLDPFDTVLIADVIEMKSGAVATSGGYGNQFDASGKYHHLFDPRSGQSSDLYASVTVKAQDATTADALSTAFSNMSEDAIKNVLGLYSDVDVRLTDMNGSVRNLH